MTVILITLLTLQQRTGMRNHYQESFAEEQISELQIVDMQGGRSVLVAAQVKRQM